jgi:hypothetical protein
MNDRVKIRFNYDTESEMEKVLSVPMFESIKTGISKITGGKVTWCEMKNLKTTFYHDTNSVNITGSLIQFRHNNQPNKKHISPELYANNTYEDICFATDYISSLFAKDKREMKLTGLEFSLTTHVPEPPSFYMGGLNSIQKKPYYYLPPPRNHSEPLEKYCSFSQYTAKCYNWGAWNDVPGNLLRWEISCRKMQKVKQLTGRRTITLADLTDKLFQRDMANFSMKTLRNTDKQFLIDCSDLQPKEMMLYHAGKDVKFWNNLKKNNVNTCKKMRADYLRLCNRLENRIDNSYHDLEYRLQSKFEYLMSN